MDNCRIADPDELRSQFIPLLLAITAIPGVIQFGFGFYNYVLYIRNPDDFSINGYIFRLIFGIPLPIILIGLMYQCPVVRRLRLIELPLIILVGFVLGCIFTCSCLLSGELLVFIFGSRLMDKTLFLLAMALFGLWLGCGMPLIIRPSLCEIMRIEGGAFKLWYSVCAIVVGPILMLTITSALGWNLDREQVVVNALAPASIGAFYVLGAGAGMIFALRRLIRWRKL